MASVAVAVQLRWGDQDVYGHVNNVALLRVLEEARSRAFWADGPLPPLRAAEPTWALIASIEVKYIRPLNYQVEPVVVEMAVDRIGGASFVIDYAVRDAPDGNVCATASSTVALVDAASGTPSRLSSEVRKALSSFSRD